MKFDLEYLEKLAETARRNALEEITIEDEDTLISFRRSVQPKSASAVIQAAPASVTSQIISPEAEKLKAQNESKGRPVKSPMAGTFYASPAPDEPPFVKEGDVISAGQIVCIVEAMKLMNEIESDVSGRISQICVKNGEIIDAGSTIMYVE